MDAFDPEPISKIRLRRRLNQIRRIADKLGFIGHVEYRHVYSHSGGAQYGRARSEEDDLLIVYAEAFDRDANPEDFSLTAILAHERGHQILVRHPRIAKMVEGKISLGSEEILASLLGSLICDDEEDRKNLISKAVAQLTKSGESADSVFEQLEPLRTLLGTLL